jgi:regulator of nucleoside diphosphate kinase
MTVKTMCVTSIDMQRLRQLLDNPDLIRQRPYLETLADALDHASIVESSAIPADVVTMNSTVRLIDLNSHEDMVLTITYPEASDINNGKISVLAPVGTAILGCRQGDTITWEVPAGVRSLRVDRVLYQPEAAGQPD